MLAQCQGCQKKFTLDSSPKVPGSKRFDINVRAVWGSMVAGNGPSHLNEFLATLNSPGLSQPLFTAIETEIGQWWHSVLKKDMLSAGQEERLLAIDRNDYHEEVPAITVITDGGWSKRTHKHSYNAAGCVAIIIGKETKKLLHIGVRNKYCYICSTNNTKEHICFINWDKDSQSMDSDVILQGFLEAERKHGVRYMRIVGDDDSSVFAKIREEFVNPVKPKTQKGKRKQSSTLANKQTRKRKSRKFSSSDSDIIDSQPQGSSQISQRQTRQRQIKILGRSIRHEWKIDETSQQKVWYKGTVVSMLSGTDGRLNAIYEVLYEGKDEPFEIDHLIQDYQSGSVRFIDFVNQVKPKTQKGKRKQSSTSANEQTRKRKSRKSSSSDSDIIDNQPQGSSQISQRFKYFRQTRQRQIKILGLSIRHEWIIDETSQQKEWYKGTVVSMLSGTDGRLNAIYEVLYEGKDEPFEIDHLIQDYQSGSVRFIDV
ncbi:unnamed protein product [Mytilus coruscus]|uniref:Mutator-like transposase domain-containing protein n=1 Tax=Mytilus coruscus TaxID=42192 RepID=A0A6J8ECE9_MYTCO|nr:unnamed protein product [Mytilus coruscus]